MRLGLKVGARLMAGLGFMRRTNERDPPPRLYRKMMLVDYAQSRWYSWVKPGAVLDGGRSGRDRLRPVGLLKGRGGEPKGGKGEGEESKRTKT